MDPDATLAPGSELCRQALEAAGARASRSPDPGTWFEAPTADGPMRLRIATQAPAHHAAAAAVALQHAESLIRGLDDWAARPLRWRWLPGPPAEFPAGAHVRLHGPDEDWQWLVPWPWLRAQPAPPAPLTALLRWPAVPAMLWLARLRLSAEELQQLEVGGAVLLPASFEPDWRGLLHGAAEPACGAPDPAGVPVALSTPWSPRSLGDDSQQPIVPAFDAPGDDPGGELCDICLSPRDPVPADRLTGWPEDGRPVLDFRGAPAGLWRCGATGAAPRRLAGGSLLPWGDGWALRLETLDRDATTAQTV